MNERKIILKEPCFNYVSLEDVRCYKFMAKKAIGSHTSSSHELCQVIMVLMQNTACMAYLKPDEKVVVVLLSDGHAKAAPWPVPLCDDNGADGSSSRKRRP